jgi:hypothetical protein
MSNFETGRPARDKNVRFIEDKAGPARSSLSRSRRLVKAGSAALALALSPLAAHAGVVFHTGQNGAGDQAVDPGPAPGETVVLDFESQSTPKGFTRIDGGAPGTFGFYTGGMNGLAAAPNGDSSQYFYVATGGSETFLFDHAARSASFYWGSIDGYNSLDVLGGSVSAPVVLETISGQQAAGAEVSARHYGQSLRFYLTDSTNEIIGLRFRSAGQSFEFDDVAISTASSPGLNGGPGLGSPTPEPSGWTMLIFGVGAIGAVARRRRVPAFQRSL